MRPVKAYRVECLVVDFEGSDTKDMVVTLEHNKYLSVTVLDSKVMEIERDKFETHPINLKRQTLEDVNVLFSLPKDGNAYVDRQLRPDTELEAENKSLKYENERLKAALRLINAESGRVLGK